MLLYEYICCKTKFGLYPGNQIGYKKTMEQKEKTERRSSRLEDRVYASLLDDIRFGRLALGHRLDSENQLAMEHSVSRPVIRSALSRLRDDGLIVSKQGAGSFVSSGVSDGVSGYAPLDSIKDIGTYFSFRRFLEAETARLAASHAQAHDIVALKELVVKMEALAELDVAGIDLDFQFHAKIAELSDNRFLSGTMNMLRSHMRYVGRFSRSLHKMQKPQRTRERSREHLAIIEAIESGDGEKAAQQMIGHIDSTERRVFKGE